MSYNGNINHIVNQDDEDIMWKFKYFVSYEGPLNNYPPNYKRSYYNVMVTWGKGGTTTNTDRVQDSLWNKNSV